LPHQLRLLLDPDTLAVTGLPAVNGDQQQATLGIHPDGGAAAVAIDSIFDPAKR
jgi:hypothetical protein